VYVPGHSTVAFSGFLSLDCTAILSEKFQTNNPLSIYSQEGNSLVNSYSMQRTPFCLSVNFFWY